MDCASLEEWWVWGQILTPVLLAALAWRLIAAAVGGPAEAPSWVFIPSLGPAASFGTLVYGLCATACLLWLFPVRLVRGAFQLLRRRRSRAWRLTRPDEWWMADHDWSPRGAAVESPHEAWSKLGNRLVLLLLLAPPSAWALHGSGPARTAAKATLLPLDAALAIAAAMAAPPLARALRCRRARLRFAWFPFRVGETFAATLVMPAPPSECERVQMTLRCLEERWHPERGRDGELVAEELYVERQAVGGEALSDSSAIEMTFRLPEGDLGTYLSEHPPRYWELEVEAKRRGGPMAFRFLVPVYDTVPYLAEPSPALRAAASTDAAIADLMRRARRPGGIRGQRQGSGVAAALSLGVEAGHFVVASPGQRRALTAAGLVELLRHDRALLKSLLQAAGRGIRPRAAFVPLGQGGAPLPPARERVDAVLGELERPDRWLLLAEVPMVREEALAWRPALGWRRMETDRAREVGLDSVIRHLRPLGAAGEGSAREQAALLVADLLARNPRARAAPLPVELRRQLASIEMLYRAAVLRLEAGTWWLADGQASGFVRGRGITIEHDGTTVLRTADTTMEDLRERVLAAAVEGTLTRFGARPPWLAAP